MTAEQLKRIATDMRAYVQEAAWTGIAEEASLVRVLSGGIFVSLRYDGSRMELAVAREDRFPSADELAVLIASFAAPVEPAISRYRCTEAHPVSGRRIRWHRTNITWIEPL